MITVLRKNETDITVKASIFHEDEVLHDVSISTDGGTTFDPKGSFDSNALSAGVDIPCPAGNIQVKIETNHNQSSELLWASSHVV